MIDYTQMIRAEVKERFGVPLCDAKIRYSSHNFVYVFPGDFVLRVHAKPAASAADQSTMAAGELPFMSDCMRLTDAVCGPVPSLNGNLAEQFTVDDIAFTVTRFKKARGRSPENRDLTQEHVMRAGEVLALIHRAGKQAMEAGIRYEMPAWHERISLPLQCFQKGEYCDLLSHQEQTAICNILENINALPVHEWENYGALHGDFNAFNYFVENGNINVFDFGDCHYGFYMYDVATAFTAWLMRPDLHREQSVSQYAGLLMKSFRAGYDKYMKLPERDWEHLLLFIKYRLAVMVLNTLSAQKGTNQVAGASESLKRLHLLTVPMASENVLESLEENARRTRTIMRRIISVLKAGAVNLPENADIKALLASDELKPFIDALVPKN